MRSRWSAAPLGGAAALAETEWNSLARRGFHHHRWFLAAEGSGWRPRHVLVGRDGEAGAVFPVYLTGADTPHDLHERWLGPLRGLARLGLDIRPVLSVQSPFSLTSDVLGDTETLPRPVLERVFELLEEIAGEERARAVVWPYVDSTDGAVIALARERGYAVVPAGATARMRIWWDSFEAYVASRSKSVRRTIRADLTALRAAGLETVTSPDYAEHAERMDALYRAAYRRRNGCDPRLAPGWLHRLAEGPAAGIDAMLTWQGGQLAGTSINLSAGAVLD
ncbi:MAG TPA: peptidogalycan biosysnthesis protein, partial [Gemmatimonadales bacterium]|nr:peptidogalycan biosysnthesis protein [Gemmatimonadales bacterium]